MLLLYYYYIILLMYINMFLNRAVETPCWHLVPSVHCLFVEAL